MLWVDLVVMKNFLNHTEKNWNDLLSVMHSAFGYSKRELQLFQL